MIAARKVGTDSLRIVPLPVTAVVMTTLSKGRRLATSRQGLGPPSYNWSATVELALHDS